MDFVPPTTTTQELHVIGLVAILFRHINIVDGTAHFLLEMIGQHTIDAQANGLVGALFVHLVETTTVVYHTNHIAMVDVVEVTSRLAHSCVDAVGQTIAHFSAHGQILFGQQLLDARGEFREFVVMLFDVLL